MNAAPQPQRGAQPQPWVVAVSVAALGALTFLRVLDPDCALARAALRQCAAQDPSGTRARHAQ